MVPLVRADVVCLICHKYHFHSIKGESLLSKIYFFLTVLSNFDTQIISQFQRGTSIAYWLSLLLPRMEWMKSWVKIYSYGPDRNSFPDWIRLQTLQFPCQRSSMNRLISTYHQIRLFSTFSSAAIFRVIFLITSSQC